LERRLFPGQSPYEPVVGFSRAVAAGRTVYVSGTAPIPPDGSDPPEGAYEQAKLCLELMGDVLARAGAGFEHVVRTRIFVTDAAHFEAVARAHGELFGEIRPASTALVVGLVDPRWKVELEAEAVLP
jgi:enamine deaminase RidA (YjgF/YER057c/UK114 family)